ncbi:NADAR family protein [Haliscomenobacter sp.]|uniref:NADAR family protein n=1 Tax=Haliscomenobacter sp. TaxID=2717303 RepID=UPI003593EFFB
MTHYNLPWLLEKIQRNEPQKFLFFWGHQPSKEGEITASCFSQWWESSPFVVAGVTYTSAEHWMMAQKALLFGDQTSFDKIIVAKTPAVAKNLGRAVQNFDLALWKEKCFELVTAGNVHKFGQHPDLKTFLLNTQDRVLVEASPLDPIWGIGLAANDPKAQDPEQWKGLNLLGFALMAARDILRS